MTPTIRRASLSDWEVLESAEREIFGSDAWSAETLRSELAHPLSWYVIAEADDSSLLGYGGLRSGPAGGQGDIQTLAVVSHYRGRGLGGQLLDALLDHARSDQLTEVFLEVRADNHSAQALYHSRGFHEIARRPGYYQPDGVDAMVMALNLVSVAQGEAR